MQLPQPQRPESAKHLCMSLMIKKLAKYLYFFLENWINQKKLISLTSFQQLTPAFVSPLLVSTINIVTLFSEISKMLSVLLGILTAHAEGEVMEGSQSTLLIPEFRSPQSASALQGQASCFCHKLVLSQRDPWLCTALPVWINVWRRSRQMGQMRTKGDLGQVLNPCNGVNQDP